MDDEVIDSGGDYVSLCAENHYAFICSGVGGDSAEGGIGEMSHQSTYFISNNYFHIIIYGLSYWTREHLNVDDYTLHKINTACLSVSPKFYRAYMCPP